MLPLRVTDAAGRRECMKYEAMLQTNAHILQLHAGVEQSASRIVAPPGYTHLRDWIHF